MLSLSPIKLMVIIAVVLLLLGPDKLPEVAHKLGSSWRALKRLQERVEEEVRDVIPDLPSASDLARVVRSPVNLLNELANRAEARDAGLTTADLTPTSVTEPESSPALAPPPAMSPMNPRLPGDAGDTGLPADPSLN